MIIGDILETGGYQVARAANGVEALDAFERISPDLILLDAKMPEMDGFEVCQHIRALPGGNIVPIIFMTGLEDENSVIRAFEAGVSDYVVKPLNWSVLNARIRNLLKSYRAEQRFQALAESATDGIITVDPEGTISYANPAIEKIFGYSAIELTNQYISILMPDDFRLPHQGSIHRFLENHEPKTIGNTVQLQGKRKNGEVFPLELSLSAIEISDALNFTGIIRDITERVKMEEKNQRLLKQQFAVNQLSLALGETLDLRDIYQIIYQHINELMDTYTFIVSLYDQDTKLIHAGFVINEGQPIDIEKLPPLPLAGSGKGIQSQVIRSGNPHYSVHYLESLKNAKTKYVIEKDGSLLDATISEDKGDTRSAIYVPMKDKGQVIGVIQVQSDKSDAYTQEDLDLLAGMANVASIAIQNARLFDDLQRELVKRKRAKKRLEHKTTELTRLYRASGALLANTTPDLDPLAKTIIDTILYEFELSNCSLLLLQPDSQTIKRVAIAGPYAHKVSQSELRLDGPGLVPLAVRSGKIINMPDVASSPNYIPNWEAARSELVIPLILDQRVIGAIDLQSAELGAFSPDDKRLLSLFAERAVLALENTRLFGISERRLDNLKALFTIDQAIATSLDVRVIMNVLLDQVIKQLAVDAAVFLLLDPHINTFRFLTSQGLRTRAFQHTNLSMGEGHAGKVALERRIIEIPDLTEAETDFARSVHFESENFISYIGVPLIAKGQVKGVLELFNRSKLNPNPEWFEFLNILAGQAAIAIDNAELFTDLQKANVEMVIAYDATLEGWAKALELRDMETEGHSRRVVDLTIQLAQQMGMPTGEMAHVRRGALLHDIGKMGVPDHILQKPGPLTQDEWEVMRQHPVYAYEWLSPIGYLRPALDIPYAHHEKWDGTGYPKGLKGKKFLYQPGYLQLWMFGMLCFHIDLIGTPGLKKRCCNTSKNNQGNISILRWWKYSLNCFRKEKNRNESENRAASNQVRIGNLPKSGGGQWW